MKKRDYLDVVYDDDAVPFTTYPDKLTRHLKSIFDIKQNAKILDIGCGRGEFVNGFINCGLDGYATDNSEAIKKFYPKIPFKKTNLENQKLPYKENTFDIVFSKSVIEHLYYPEKLVKEIYRVLKPGGKVITMCPDWKYNYKIYFEDYTHRTPFMETSLKDIFLIHDFNNVTVTKFRQLPIVWKFKFLIIFSELTRYFFPCILKKFKWVKFSKEIMLLAYAKKPNK